MIRARSLEFLSSEKERTQLFEDPTEDTNEENDFIWTRDMEFRQELIYFLVVDRFYDGDPSNNEGPNPELYDAEKKVWGKYWGGDLEGIIVKLDYLRNMGVTAIWLTPLFEQVEYLADSGRPDGMAAAMHGYWAKDFKRMNSRYLAPGENISIFKTGSQSNTFDRLVKEMHKRNMKLVLDIVCNHSSPPGADGKKGEIYDDGHLLADFNNDTKGFYHHYGTVTNWEDNWQVQNCELCGLATFNENCIEYRDYIKSSIKLWLDRGVDALRIDTVKHMPIWFWQEFTADIRFHKPNTFIFGEWIWNSPTNPISTDFANHSGMTILDFGFCQAIRTAVAENKGWGILQALLDQDGAWNGATELVTFIDNHDMPRFQSLNSDLDVLRIAIIVLMTSRGIPCLFYGTEQGLHDDTNAGNDPYNRPMMDKFDVNAPVYNAVRLLSYARRRNTAVQLGGQWPKFVSDDIYVYVRRYKSTRCFVAVNKGNEAKTFQPEELETEFPDGPTRCLLTKRQFHIVGGRFTAPFTLNAKEGIVLSHIGDLSESQAVVRVQLNDCPTELGDEVVVIGNCPELGNWDDSKGVPLEFINKNTWFGEIPIEESAGKMIAYKYAIRRPNHLAIRENAVARRWHLPQEGLVKWRDHWRGATISFA